MFKLIALVLGLGIGFGSGVWWGVHHPTSAASLSAEEEQNVLAQTQTLREKIHNLVVKQQGGGGIAGTGIGSNLVGGGASTPAVDPDLKELDDKAQSQLDMLKAKLGK
jgi:hypothetical protein